MEDIAPFDEARVRAVLGHFVTGVVLVTAAAAGPLGFTCQSFASLSLRPALVSLSPARTSTTWPRIRAIGRFCVNILAEDQEALSRAFARSGADKYRGLAWTPAPSGSPVLDGVVAWVDCELHAEYDGGDHTIVVGRVRALHCAADRRPLLYHRGRYTQVRPAGPAALSYCAA
ncbi:flavin reductase family protein [Dactylosporangium sp. CA-092794]|uniref:flavin reductase family protein n=1 Tax=Dactylosporangium sp. CA-092794 TaxID=3239929 RepID=UPI003D8AF1F2